MNFYENDQTAEQFIAFLNSENGQLQQKILLAALQPHLPHSADAKLLDAACGTGWLAGVLNKTYDRVEAFDSSKKLIREARRNFPKVPFQIHDISNTLPYPNEHFDCVILNMASHDLEDQPKSFANLCACLKPGGTFIMTLANPYYAFPVGVWKRGWIGKLLGQKPKLVLRPYAWFAKNSHNAFNWQQNLTSRFYPLSVQINNLLGAGLKLESMQDLSSQQDSPKFNVAYQLHRFPTLLLLVLKKPAE